MRVLSIGLSQARHFDSFGFKAVYYFGPRFAGNGKDEFHTTDHIKVSECISLLTSVGKEVDLIIVFTDPFAFHLINVVVDSHIRPVVALVGDTHHGPSPIRSVKAWLTANKVTKVVLKQTKHQKIIFENMGCEVLAMPYYLVDPHFKEPRHDPYQKACFVGSYSDYHSRRKRVLESISSEIAIDIHSVPRDLSLKYYNAYSVSLNVPLCSDVNYKIHEIASAGGCLVTERLSSLAAKYEVLEEGLDYFAFDNTKQAVEICQALLEDNDLRLKTALSAHRKIVKHHDSKTLSTLIVALALSTRSSEVESLPKDDLAEDFTRRWEYFQECFRSNPGLEVPAEFKSLLSSARYE